VLAIFGHRPFEPIGGSVEPEHHSATEINVSSWEGFVLDISYGKKELVSAVHWVEKGESKFVFASMLHLLKKCIYRFAQGPKVQHHSNCEPTVFDVVGSYAPMRSYEDFRIEPMFTTREGLQKTTDL
jgi:hypothetical protein